MHQTADPTIRLELLDLIITQRREIRRTQAALATNASEARELRVTLKAQEKKLASLQDEEDDRPLFNGVTHVEKPSELDVSQGDPAVFNSRGFAKAAEQAGPDEFDPPATCRICGGVADKPYLKRRPNSKKACHFSADGKVRSLGTSPEALIAASADPDVIVGDLEQLLEAESEADADEPAETTPDGGQVEDDEAHSAALRDGDEPVANQVVPGVSIVKTPAAPPDADLRATTRANLPAHQRKLMDDPNVDDAGVYTNAELIEVPLPKDTGCKASISVALGSDGIWRSGHDVETPKGGTHAPVSLRVAPESQTREVAILVECETIATWLRKDRLLKAAKAVEAVAEGVRQPALALEPLSSDLLFEDWRDVETGDLGLPERLSAYLADKLGLQTARQLGDWIGTIDLDSPIPTEQKLWWDIARRHACHGLVMLALDRIRELSKAEETPEPPGPEIASETAPGSVDKPSRYMLLHGPVGGPYELVDQFAAQSIDHAFGLTKEKVGWQLHNFPDGLSIQCKSGPVYRATDEGDWRAHVVPEPFEGQKPIVAGVNDTLIVLGTGTPRLYEVRWKDLEHDDFLVTVKAMTKPMAVKLAEHWLARYRPKLPKWKLVVQPTNEAKAAKRTARRDRSKRLLAAALNRPTTDDRSKMIALESTPPDGARP